MTWEAVARRLSRRVLLECHIFGMLSVDGALLVVLQFFISVLFGAYLYRPEKSCAAFCPSCSFCISCSFSCKQAFRLNRLFPIPWLILTVRLASLYLFGVLSALLVLRDERRNGAG